MRLLESVEQGDAVSACSEEFPEYSGSELTQSNVSPKTADETNRSDQNKEIDDGYEDSMTVVIVSVNNLERWNRSESRELLNERESSGDHSLGSDN